MAPRGACDDARRPRPACDGWWKRPPFVFFFLPSPPIEPPPRLIASYQGSRTRRCRGALGSCVALRSTPTSGSSCPRRGRPTSGRCRVARARADQAEGTKRPTGDPKVGLESPRRVRRRPISVAAFKSAHERGGVWGGWGGGGSNDPARLVARPRQRPPHPGRREQHVGVPGVPPGTSRGRNATSMAGSRSARFSGRNALQDLGG